MTGRRYKRVSVCGDIFGEILTTGWCSYRDGYVTECSQGLPKGARFISAGLDPTTNVIHLVFEHESFDMVPHGEIIPIMEIDYSSKKLEGSLANIILNVYENDRVLTKRIAESVSRELQKGMR